MGSRLSDDLNPEKENMVTHAVQFPNALWANIKKDAREMNIPIAEWIRQASYDRLDMEPSKKVRRIPDRQVKVFEIFDMIKALIGDTKKQAVFLSFDNLLISEWPKWFQARDAVRTLRLMLLAINVEAVIKEEVRGEKVPETGRTRTIKEGFTISFEHPIKAEAMDQYKKSVISKLQTTSLTQILVEKESKIPKRPSIDDNTLSSLGYDDGE